MSADIELSLDVAVLATRLSYLVGQRSELDIEIADLKAKIRSTVPVGGRGLIDGRAVVAVTANRRFDPQYAMTHLPAELVELCMVNKFDTTQAKQVLPAAVYGSCCRETGEPVVRTL